MKFYFTDLLTPVGTLKIVASDEGLVAILWDKDNREIVKLNSLIRKDTHKIIKETISQLKEYFDGIREKFDLPLKPQGTDFQIRVWNALSNIPFGSTKSYKDIAKIVGSPKAYRAVGSANGKNPIAIIIPCHRVISSSGKLSGFAGGIEAKEILLLGEEKV